MENGKTESFIRIKRNNHRCNLNTLQMQPNRKSSLLTTYNLTIWLHMTPSHWGDEKSVECLIYGRINLVCHLSKENWRITSGSTFNIRRLLLMDSKPGPWGTWSTVPWFMKTNFILKCYMQWWQEYCFLHVGPFHVS